MTGLRRTRDSSPPGTVVDIVTSVSCDVTGFTKCHAVGEERQNRVSDDVAACETPSVFY